ncbi:MAG: PIN domain-containing protein [Atopobiaceae bacterium]|jgi:predicted nucleic acid-binding protein|nr:PIN domain-containing protein [Atopobiaceae bacterium]
MSRILLDTNALIDMVFLRDADRHRAMEEVISLCREGGDEVLLPALALEDASYVLENSPSAKAAVPDAALRRRIAREARGFALRLCTICCIDDAVCRAAHENTGEQDFDDALVAECARFSKADVIVSSDARAFVHSAVPKVTPRECVEFLRR